MKCFIVITLLVTFQLVASKNVEKPGNKKASSAKPTKTPKSVLDHFTELPADDLEFIKQLDKQFKLHGEKVKIKVERVNKTSTDGKNSKRTIDGELGYGYYGNQNNNGFYFTKPKIVYYRYSQPGQDIPPAPAHAKQHSYGQDAVHETVTDIQIQPSQSYELKDANGYQGYQQQHSQEQQYYHQQQHQQQHSNEPVIVLRIPGPQKYAAHLQTLLQQYLELRAAQLFKEFEEQEKSRQYLPQAQALVQPVQHYAVPQPTPHYAPITQPSYSHALAPVYPQAMYHTAVSHVQQQYAYSQADKSQESDQHQQQETDYQYEQPQYQTQQQHYSAEQQYEQQPQAEQHYQHQEDEGEQQYEQPQYYSQQDYSAEQPQTQVITKYVYEKPVSEPAHTQQSAHGDEEDLQTYENYPSDTHTQVTFKNHYADSKNYGQQNTQTHYKYQEEKESREHSNYVTQLPQSVVSITPKPYNYHAHSVTAATTHTRSNKRNTGAAAPYSEEQFKNISKLISRLRKTKSVLETKAA